MQVDYENNEIEASTDEEFAAKYAAVLMRAIMETSEQTEISICFINDIVIKTLVLNMQKNGHAACAKSMLSDASKLVLDLEADDAQAVRH